MIVYRLISFHCSSNNKSDVSELSDKEEEIDYGAASEASLDSDFDEKDDEFQAPHVVPQQPLIPSQQQPHLHPRLFYSSCDRMRWHIHPPALPAIVPNAIYEGVCTSKLQKQKLNRGNCSLISPC